MNNLIARTLTGLGLIVLIIFSIIVSKYFFAAILFILVVLGLIEFFRLIKSDIIFPQKIFSVIIGSIIFLLNLGVAFNQIELKFLVLIFPLLFLIFLAELFRNHQNPLLNTVYSLFGLIYIVFPFSLLLYFYHIDPSTLKDHHQLLLAFFIFIWTNDTMAYVTGKNFGKHPLFKKISPKKTIEGTAGGVISSIVAAFIISKFITDYTFVQWLFLALITVITAIFGDLVESFIKRSLNKKDSGSLFPGHGGLLDRFDSVLLAAPFVVAYIILIL